MNNSFELQGFFEEKNGVLTYLTVTSQLAPLPAHLHILSSGESEL